MTTYLALLRGINVGGKALIRMANLQTALTEVGLTNVRTYIQSGNVIFESNSTADQLCKQIKTTLLERFHMNVDMAVFSKAEWQQIIYAAPAWWGKDKTWKHNMIVLIKPYDMDQVIKAIGVLKPDIEAMEPGNGVLYQSMLLKLFGRTTTGKLASSPVYKQMTIRNYNTATKLATLMS